MKFWKARNAALIHHNFFRSRHGTAPLSRNADLDLLAQMCADYYRTKGYMDHSCLYRQQGYNFYLNEGTGESLFGGGFGMLSTWSLFESAVGGTWSFYQEIENYNYSDYKTDVETHFWNIGHFTQMVWKETTQMGFGISTDTDGARMCVYVYYTAGNVVDEEKSMFPKNVKPVLPNAPALKEWRH